MRSPIGVLAATKIKLILLNFELLFSPSPAVIPVTDSCLTSWTALGMCNDRWRANISTSSSFARYGVAQTLSFENRARERSLIDRIAKGRTDLVIDYVDQDNEVGAVDSNGVSLIQWCSYYGDVSAIKFLLKNGERLNSLGGNFGLNGAAFHGHWRLCQFLLEAGADANYAEPGTGETALHASMTKPNRPSYTIVAKVLLSFGADPNMKTVPEAETGSFMRDARTRGETPLHRAAAFGDAEAVEMLLHAGARVDAKDVSGDTSLSWASWHTRPDEILRLLCHGKFSIRADRSSSFDHGRGWGAMERAILGTP